MLRNMEQTNDDDNSTKNIRKENINKVDSDVSGFGVDNVDSIDEMANVLTQNCQLPSNDAFLSCDSKVVNQLSENNNVFDNGNETDIIEQKDNSERIEETSKQKNDICDKISDDEQEYKDNLCMDPFEAADAAIRDMDEDGIDKTSDYIEEHSESDGCIDKQYSNGNSVEDGYEQTEAPSLETVLKTDQIPEVDPISRPAQEEFEAKNKRTGRTFPMPTMNLLEEIVYFQDTTIESQNDNGIGQEREMRHSPNEINELAFREKDDAVLNEIRCMLHKPVTVIPSNETNNAKYPSEKKQNNADSHNKLEFVNRADNKSTTHSNSHQTTNENVDQNNSTVHIVGEDEVKSCELSQSNDTDIKSTNLENFDNIFDSYMSNHEHIKMKMAELKRNRAREIDIVRNKDEKEAPSQNNTASDCSIPGETLNDQCNELQTALEPDSTFSESTKEEYNTNESNPMIEEHSNDAINKLESDSTQNDVTNDEIAQQRDQSNMEEEPKCDKKTKLVNKSSDVSAEQSFISEKPQNLKSEVKSLRKPLGVVEKTVGIIAPTLKSVNKKPMNVNEDMASSKGSTIRSTSNVNNAIANTKRVSQSTGKPKPETTPVKASLSKASTGVVTKLNDTHKAPIKSTSSMKSTEPSNKLHSTTLKTQQLSLTKKEESDDHEVSKEKESEDHKVVKQTTMLEDSADSVQENQYESENLPKKSAERSPFEPIEWIERLVPAFENMWALCFTEEMGETQQDTEQSEENLHKGDNEIIKEDGGNTDYKKETQTISEESFESVSDQCQNPYLVQMDAPIHKHIEEVNQTTYPMSLKEELAQAMEVESNISEIEKHGIVKEFEMESELKSDQYDNHKSDLFEEASSSHPEETNLIETEQTAVEISYPTQNMNTEASKDSLTEIAGKKDIDSDVINKKPSNEPSESECITPQSAHGEIRSVESEEDKESVNHQQYNRHNLIEEYTPKRDVSSEQETITMKIPADDKKSDLQHQSKETVSDDMESGKEHLKEEETINEETSEKEKGPRQHGRGQFRGIMMSEQKNWKPTGKKQKTVKKDKSREGTPGEEFPQSKQRRRGKRSGKGQKPSTQ